MNVDHYTYRVTWSPEDGEHVALWTASTLPCALNSRRCRGSQRRQRQR